MMNYYYKKSVCKWIHHSLPWRSQALFYYCIAPILWSPISIIIIIIMAPSIWEDNGDASKITESGLFRTETTVAEQANPWVAVPRALGANKAGWKRYGECCSCFPSRTFVRPHVGPLFLCQDDASMNWLPPLAAICCWLLPCVDIDVSRLHVTLACHIHKLIIKSNLAKKIIFNGLFKGVFVWLWYLSLLKTKDFFLIYCYSVYTYCSCYWWQYVHFLFPYSSNFGIIPRNMVNCG